MSTPQFTYAWGGETSELWGFTLWIAALLKITAKTSFSPPSNVIELSTTIAIRSQGQCTVKKKNDFGKR